MTETVTNNDKPAGPQDGVVSAAEFESLKRSRLAFEEDFPYDTPGTLWRISSVRDFKEREIPHVNWFADEEAARKYADWITAGTGRVVSLSKYQSDPTVAEMLRAANDVLRSASEIAKRNGEKTNWESFRAALDSVLKEQHRVMYPEPLESR